MAVSSHALLEMPWHLAERWGLSPVGFPVRKGMVTRILTDDDVDLGLLLEEVDRFLDEHPDARWLHQDNVSLVAYYGAKAAAASGQYDEVVRFAELGLKYRPLNHSHHAHLGLARQCLGDLEGAVEAYRFILEDPQADADVLVRGFCAQALLELGRAYEGLTLCWPPPMGLETDDGWWKLVERLCDACEVPYPARPSRPAEARRLRELLQEVPGVGEPQRSALVERFETLRALAAASPGSIAAADGMTRELATLVYARLHPQRIVDAANLPPALRAS